MKNKEIYFRILLFILGALLSYFTIQFKYFDINLEINVVELSLSVLTLLVGVYIVEVIQKNQTKNQNIHSFLESKINDIWLCHSNFILLLKEPKIDLNSVVGYHKDLTRKISFLSTLFSSFQLDDNLVSNLEVSVDEIETLLTSQKMTQNVVNLENIHPEINDLVLKADASLKDIFLCLHSM